MQEFIRTLSQRTLAILALGLVLLLYSVISRPADIFFFWESGVAGASTIAASVASLFWDRIVWKKSARKSSIPEKIAFGVVLFFLFIQCILMLVFPRSDAYAAAKSHLMADPVLNEALGGIETITVLPVGGLETATDENGHYGQAELSLILKGKTRYRSVTVSLVLEPEDSHWKVVAVE